MEIAEFKKMTTHILVLDGETFSIYHKERRLYSFVDWKDSRDKLIKIMLARIKVETGENTAFIDFKMANPMRKSRLGNFFIDIVADVKVKGKSLGTLVELGMKNILIDRFETLDPDEVEMRLERDAIYCREQYEEELNSRVNSLSKLNNADMINLNYSAENLKKQVKELMEKEGWCITSDNRYFARKKRLELI